MPSRSSAISCALGGVQVGREHLAVAAVGEGGVEHPAGLAHQSLGGPGVAVVEVGDDGVEQVGGDGADRAELVDCGQVDDAFADQLLGALRELEHLHARGDALLGPAERLRGAVLGQAALEHRADGLGLLVGVELLARDLCRPRGHADVRVEVPTVRCEPCGEVGIRTQTDPGSQAAADDRLMGPAARLPKASAPSAPGDTLAFRPERKWAVLTGGARLPARAVVALARENNSRSRMRMPTPTPLARLSSPDGSNPTPAVPRRRAR